MLRPKPEIMPKCTIYFGNKAADCNVKNEAINVSFYSTCSKNNKQLDNVFA